MRTETDLAFRDCRNDDLPQVQYLMHQLYLQDPNVKDICPDISLTFKEFQARPDKGRLVVIVKEAVVVGYAILIHFWSNEYSNNLIEIDEIYIDDSARGSGLGTKFFSWLKADYGEKCAGWTLQVAHTNPGAAKLYERLGFESSRNRHMIHIFNKHHD